MFLDAEQEWIENCSACQTEYTENKGANCSLSCEEKQLEIEHEKIVQKIVDNYFSKERIKLSFPRDTLKIWGEVNLITKTVTIPWLTLRSKKEFLDTLIHELGHIIAFRKKFSIKFRQILADFYFLQLKRESVYSYFAEQELGNYYLLHRQVIDSYRREYKISKGGHWWDPWHLEYLKTFGNLLTSPYIKYFYGYTKPRLHGFNEYGEGEYDMSKSFVPKNKKN